MNRRQLFKSAIATFALSTGLARARLDLIDDRPPGMYIGPIEGLTIEPGPVLHCASDDAFVLWDGDTLHVSGIVRKKIIMNDPRRAGTY